MDGNLKLLVLDLERFAAANESGPDVAQALDNVAQSGAQVRLSSGRILVVEAPELTEYDVQESVPGARLMPLDAEIADLEPPLDESETLFLEAFRISSSAKYQREKALQVPGESPEEQLMFTAPCVPGGEGNAK